MQFTVNLTAGQKFTQQTAGALFVLMDTGAAASIDVRFVAGPQELEHITTGKRGLKARMPTPTRFTAVEFIAPTNCTCLFVISDGLIDINTTDGASVAATILGLPLPVSNDRGSPGNPIYISGETPGTGPASAVLNDAAVAVDASGESLLAAATNRVRAVFANLGASPVAIGAPGLTWAQRAIVLQPGDTWVEDRAANLAWSAICAAGTNTSVGVQEVTA